MSMSEIRSRTAQAAGVAQDVADRVIQAFLIEVTAAVRDGEVGLPTRRGRDDPTGASARGASIHGGPGD